MEDRLHKLATIIEQGSFVGAAQKLRISQPALSTAIQKLERELGAELLNRHAKKLQPTPAGHLAYKHAKMLQTNAANLTLRLRELAGQKPRLAIGLIDSVASAFLTGGTELATLEEKANINLSVNNSRYLLRMLGRGELDIACLTVNPVTGPKNIETTFLCNESLAGVVQPDISAKIQGAMNRGRLPNFLAYDQQSRTNHLIRQHLVKEGIAVQPIFHSTSPEILLHMALFGRGPTVLPHALVAPHIIHGRLSQIGVLVPRPLFIAQQSGKHLPPIAYRLPSMILSALQRQPPQQ